MDMRYFMKPFDQLQEAAIRRQFRLMYHDIGLDESLVVLREIIVTGAILAEVLAEELDEKSKENKGKEGMEPT